MILPSNSTHGSQFLKAGFPPSSAESKLPHLRKKKRLKITFVQIHGSEFKKSEESNICPKSLVRLEVQTLLYPELSGFFVDQFLNQLS